jgi:protein TonB
MDRTEQRRLERLALAESNPTYTDGMGELVYIMGEVDPAFIGGNKAMMDYLRDNLSYPKDAQNRGEEGTVFVDFIVTKTGSVRGVEITDLDSENVDQSLRDEAIRVVSSMPAWTPGSQLGTTVNVKYSIPITFRM